jgi:hypothetical protein
MRLALVLFGLCITCADAEEPFVQGIIRIVPPVRQEEGKHHTLEVNLFNDGGTKMFRITDAKGKEFAVYVDRRIGSRTPGAIYLIDYPGSPNSVRVVNERDFRRKIRLPHVLK